MERHADRENLFTYACGEPRKALLAALKNDELTWRQLHNLLAKYGLELRKKGQGFAIYDLSPNATTTAPIKASDMHEALSKARLTKRLGPFEPSASTTSAVLTYDKDRLPKRDPKIRKVRCQERVHISPTRPGYCAVAILGYPRSSPPEAARDPRDRHGRCGIAIGYDARSAESVRRCAQTQRIAGRHTASGSSARRPPATARLSASYAASSTARSDARES